MKQDFLRRLSALALALAMAVSLCLTPAWADEDTDGSGGTGDGSGPSGGDSTTTDPYSLELTRELMILTKEANKNEQELSINIPGDLPEGLNVSWTSSSPAITVTPQVGKTVMVRYSGTGNVSNARIEAHISSSTGQNVNYVRTCYVYGEASPVTPITNPKSVSAGASITETINVFEHARLVGDIYFESGNPAIAEVGMVEHDYKVNGEEANHTVTIKGISAGQAEIMVYAKNDQLLGSWTVTVTPEIAGTAVTEVYFSPNTYTMNVGETRTLTPTIVPSTATNKTVSWSATPTDIVSVDANGRVTALKAGTATVTATANGGNSVQGTCTITVSEGPSTVTLDRTTLTLDKTKNEISGTITATLSGDNSSTATVKWTSSNTSVAAVSGSGTGATVTAGNTAGTATITATATFGSGSSTQTRTATCIVTVIDENSVRVDSITLSEKTHSMPADGSFTLTATVSPANAPVKTVTWTTGTGKEDVVKVDPTTGRVTAVAPGEVTVIATAYGGVQERCTVTVTEKAETIRLSFSYDSNVPVGSNDYTYMFKSNSNDYISVRAILGPSGTYAPADPIHWKSSNTAVATVSNTTGATATITAVSPGRTTVSAVPMDPNGKDREIDPAEITVTVSGLSLDRTTLTLVQGRRETLVATAWGSANTGNSSCDWTSSDPSIVSISTKTGESTTLTARTPGTVIITARKGTYTATCSVTVSEDSVGLIDGISTPAATPYQFSNLASKLQSACSQKTGRDLAYITNLAVSSTDQGILYDQHHSSEDTGAGVGIQDRYYVGTAPQGQRSLSDLSFVPRNTFSGTAEISYTGWSSDNQSFTGVIRITVNGTGDVVYSSNDGSVVTFAAEDFNFYHPNLKSVTFTPPQDSVGTLYYNYTNASQPGTKVASGTAYNRTSTPSIDRVSFVPAAGYEGTVKISYRGTDTGGTSFTGTVTITVTKGDGSSGSPADISYSTKDDGWVTFRPSDFATASLQTLGESLSYVRFTLPPSSEGTLFYNYRGFSDFDSMVTSTTSYYYSGNPALSGVTFVPTTTTPGQVDIAYTGYTTRGNTFEGTIHISLNDTPQVQQLLHYTVFTGKSVNLTASDFNTACYNATGYNLVSVQFNSLPTVSQGVLRYTQGNSSTPYNVSTGMRFLRSGTTGYLLGNVYFQAASNYTGTVTIPFTGTNERGTTFTDEVVIVVTPPTATDITCSGTTASPIRLSSAQVQSANSGVLSNVSYITFTTLPGSTAGKLYTGYNGFGTGTQVNTGTRYYVSGSPGIDQISFVPRGRYSGQTSVAYTATSTSGENVSGRIVFNITSTGNSTYFSDMIYHTWAGPSVDYLYLNKVTNGVTATSFGPNQQILRCDFVLMLCRAFGFTGANGYSFPDVPTDSYFSQAVATAKQMGIVNGDGGNFKPYSPITRQDAMVIIKNAMDAAGWNTGNASSSVLNQFSDSGSVSSYARNAVSTLVQLGAVTGDDGRLLPHNSITRAEAAVILHFVMTM